MKIEIDEKYLNVKITSPDGGFIEKQSVEAVLLARLLLILEGNLTPYAADLPKAGAKYERCPECGTPLRVVYDPSANR